MRARTVKPEFFRDRKIGQLGAVGALVYEALWIVADDGGMAECDPDLLKGEMFTYWSAVGVPEITEALRHLSAAGRIEFYASGDRTFCQIVRWNEHQHIHKPSEYRYSKALKDFQQIAPLWCGTGAVVVPHSPDSPCPISPCPDPLVPTHTEGAPSALVGVSLVPVSNGKGKHPARSYADITHRIAALFAYTLETGQKAMKADETRDLQADIVFAYWAAKLGHEGAMLDAKRLNRLKERLRENQGNVHELLFVVDGTRKDDYLMGRSGPQKYDGIETIFRDRGQVEKLSEKGGFGPGKTHPMADKYEALVNG